MTDTDKAARYDELRTRPDELTPDEQVELEALAAELEADTDDTDEADGAPRFAVYDVTLLRYVGRTHETRKAANEAKKSGPTGHQLEVRKV